MTAKEQVLSVDNQAKVAIWGNERDGQGFWIHGRGWETKITYSEAHAWEIALAEVFGEENSCLTNTQYA